MAIKKVQYGWCPDLPDARDFAYSAPKKLVPETVSLKRRCPAVYDQLELGACTANAIGASFEYDLHVQGLKDFRPSRLQIYYDEREMEGTIKSDAGAFIRDGIKVVAKKGVCPESLWPYNVKKFAVKPPKQVYEAALKHKAIQYERVSRTIGQLCGCLADGRPFVFGFSVYDSFESDKVAKSGILNIPGPDERLLGGHAVMAVGYSMKTARFVVRNSWGAGWGQKGYFTMPFDYLLNSSLSDDFWTIRTVV